MARGAASSRPRPAREAKRPLPDPWDAPLADLRLLPVPPGAPSDLKIRTEAPRPVLAADAALDTELGQGAKPIDGTARPHRLVVIGDSISQGFQSFAIHRTDASWPAMVAGAFGFDFRYPTFAGPSGSPGLPFNLESIAAAVQAELGDKPFGSNAPAGIAAILRELHTIHDYWSDGEGSTNPAQSGFNDNLAVWGFDLRDAMSKSRRRAQEFIDERHGLLGQWLNPVHHLTASHANELTTLRTLLNDDEPSPDVTQVSAAQSMGAENGGAGIDTLVVALGANNALQTVAQLEIRWSGEGYDDLKRKKDYNLWTPEHFRQELAALVAQVLAIGSARTLWVTVPHVTVVPILRGVGEKPYYSRYYARYTHAWIDDDDFDGNESACLTGEQVRMIDATIDEYNWAIKRHVHEQRQQGRDWLLVDLCGLLDRLAYQRYLASPQSRPSWWSDVPTEDALMPLALLDLTPRPDTRFFLSDKRGRTQGGLIALDGVHPTTIGYGLIAQFVIDVLNGPGGVRRTGDGEKAELDWSRIVRDDTLITSPPAQLTEIGQLLGPLNQKFDVLSTLVGWRPL